MIDILRKHIIANLQFNTRSDFFNKSFKIIIGKYFNDDIDSCIKLLPNNKTNINTFNEEKYYKDTIEFLLNQGICNKLNILLNVSLITIDIKEDEIFTPYDTIYKKYFIAMFIDKRKFVNEYISSINIPNGVNFFYKGKNTVYYRIECNLSKTEYDNIVVIGQQIEMLLHKIDNEILQINKLFEVI